jgi:IS5 family transposase
MWVHFRKRFSEDELSRIKKLIAERGKPMVMEAVEARQDEDDSDDPDANAATSSQSMTVKPADWPEGKNWGTLSIDASSTPADLTYPTVLKLPNEVRETTELIIDEHCEHSSDLCNYKSRSYCGKTRDTFLSVAEKKCCFAAG